MHSGGGGGMHRGGGGDARASCASPPGTPLDPDPQHCLPARLENLIIPKRGLRKYSIEWFQKGKYRGLYIGPKTILSPMHFSTYIYSSRTLFAFNLARAAVAFYFSFLYSPQITSCFPQGGFFQHVCTLTKHTDMIATHFILCLCHLFQKSLFYSVQCAKPRDKTFNLLFFRAGLCAEVRDETVSNTFWFSVPHTRKK
jgi:hypothetical protein